MSHYVKVWTNNRNKHSLHINATMSTHREFYRVEDEQAPASVASHHASSSAISPDAHALQLCQHIRQNVIGAHHDFASPFGRRRITYCDYTASGRSLQFIEDYIQQHVLPTYGNTHTTTSMCGQQTTLLRAEARQIIAQSVHCGKDDVVLFAGSGSTSAIMLLVRTLNISKLDRPVVFVGPV
jgi:selenocysteine lyase/cysteine desulfurase